MANFYLAVKSTLDKMAIDLATTLGLAAVELDDVTNVENALASPDDLIMYQLVDMQPDRQDPLFDLQFQIGAKTTSDSVNYDLAKLIAAVQDEIAVGDTFFIRDYSMVAPPTVNLGYIYVTNVQTDPQAFEGLSGVRMQTAYAKVVRYL